MKTWMLLLLAALLGGCQTMAHRPTKISEPVAIAVAGDVAAYIADHHPVETTIWKIDGDGTIAATAVAAALRQQGYEVIEAIQAEEAKDDQKAPRTTPLGITSASAPGIVVITITLDGAKLSRGYDAMNGHPQTAWSRRAK